MRGVPFILCLIAAAAVIFACGKWIDNSYAFFAAYVVVQYIVLGTAWNIRRRTWGFRRSSTSSAATPAM